MLMVGACAGFSISMRPSLAPTVRRPRLMMADGEDAEPDKAAVAMEKVRRRSARAPYFSRSARATGALVSRMRSG